MKKLLVLALGACLISASSNAQAVKQSGGEKNFQVLFAPLGGNPISLGGITFRKFNAAGDAAFRVNLFIGLNSSTEITNQADTSNHVIAGDAGSPKTEENTSGMTISIRPGYEKHMAGTDKLSPYVGAEILFSMSTSSVESDTLLVNNTVTPGSWNVETLEKTGDGASTTFGVNLIAGIDYYIAKNLSLGAEFGFGFSTTSMPDIENQRVKRDNTTGAYTIIDTPAAEQGSSMQVGPNVVAQFKLGWLF